MRWVPDLPGVAGWVGWRLGERLREEGTRVGGGASETRPGRPERIPPGSDQTVVTVKERRCRARGRAAFRPLYHDFEIRQTTMAAMAAMAGFSTNFFDGLLFSNEVAGSEKSKRIDLELAVLAA